MMKLHQASYLANESLRTLVRHKGIMILSIVIMSLTLLVLAVFLLATDNILLALDNTRREFKVYAYLREDVPTHVVEEHYKTLLSHAGVESIVFISKTEALAEFREELGDEAFMLEALDANPLPASFKITLRDEYRNSERTEAFAVEAAALPGIEEVNYGKDFLDRFSLMAKIFLYVDAALGGIVILSAIFIISNTVRLTILSRVKTIEILKLVGATDRFITTPFVIEGALQGGLAALISLGLLGGVFVFFQRMVPDMAFLGIDKMVLYVATCILLGSIGSYTALRRFVRL